MYLAVDSKNKEYRFSYSPYRVWVDRNDKSKGGVWRPLKSNDRWFNLEPGTIKKWSGKELTWAESPIKISQAEINTRLLFIAPQGLLEVLRNETNDLKILFLEKTKTYAQSEFDKAKEIYQRTAKDWCEIFEIEPMVDGDYVGFPNNFWKTDNGRYYSSKSSAARDIVWKGKDKFVADAIKKAERHYVSSLQKLIDRLVKKGLTDTNFQIIEKSLGVNFDLLLEHEFEGRKIQTRCWTIIAEGEIQKPHYRYLVN